MAVRDAYCILEKKCKFEAVSETPPILTSTSILPLSLFIYKVPSEVLEHRDQKFVQVRQIICRYLSAHTKFRLKCSVTSCGLLVSADEHMLW